MKTKERVSASGSTGFPPGVSEALQIKNSIPTPEACNGKISFGKADEHGWGEGEESWRSEYWPLPGPWEVRPDISTNSCVMYGTVFTNDVPASFIVRWNEVFLGGDKNLCATFEAEFFPNGDVVYRYFEGCSNLAVLNACKMGVMMNGAGWSTSGVGEGREIRLKKLGTLAEEKAKRIPGLKLTEFEAWYYQIDTTLAYDIPPGLLLWLGLCPHDIEKAMAALPFDILYFMDLNDISLADLIMKYCINPFVGVPDAAIKNHHGKPNHPLFNPAYGGLPVYIKQAEPLEEDAMALLTIGTLLLPLSESSTQSWTLYLDPKTNYTFSLRSLRNPTVNLNLTNEPIDPNKTPFFICVEDLGGEREGRGGGK